MEIEKYGRTDSNRPGLGIVKWFGGDGDEHSASINAVNIVTYKGLAWRKTVGSRLGDWIYWMLSSRNYK
jgi:hypothetical protein